MLIGPITANRGTPVPRSKQDSYVPPPMVEYMLPPEELERYRAMKTPKRQERFVNVDATYRHK